jgi:hypothetical protein
VASPSVLQERISAWSASVSSWGRCGPRCMLGNGVGCHRLGFKQQGDGGILRFWECRRSAAGCQ